MPGLETIHQNAVRFKERVRGVEIAQGPRPAAVHAVVYLKAHPRMPATQFPKELLNILPFFIEVVPGQVTVVLGVAGVAEA